MRKNNLKLTDENGLSSSQAEDLLKKVGKNELVASKATPLWKKIWKHLSDLSSLVLLVAIILATYLAIFQNGGWTKTIVISAILIINVFVGLYQEASAEKALSALKSMSFPTSDVRRDGTVQSIPSSQIVPGDLVLLTAGNQVPADAIVLESANLQIDEAILTGESEAVEKKAYQNSTKEDDANLVYSGTAVTTGTGLIQVLHTGMDTELGKIADLLNNTAPTPSPLQQKLNRLIAWLTLVAVVGGVFIFILNLIMQDQSLAESLMIGLSLAVAAVPETLPVIVTISLSHGVRQMAHRNAVMRRISAVETTGSVEIIASDKTGTLTQNKMTVTKFWTKNDGIKKTSEPGPLTDSSKKLITYFGLATNAEINVVDGEEQAIGDATEIAIVRWLSSETITRADQEEKYPRVSEDPFDSSSKTMTTVHILPDKKRLVIVKGALDRLPLKNASEQLKEANKVHDQFGKEGLRVLAVGYKVIDPSIPSDDWEKINSNLTLYGLIGIIDPPRPEVAKAIKKAKGAGIRTIMITGDHIVTASAIAKQIGILDKDHMIISGEDLKKLSDDELASKLEKISVYARVTPEDKIRIVKQWQQKGAVVAMTGDGVNDAPALKAANVGIAMGNTGTDVARSSADMVLTDDNFASIISAVDEGRTVYQNILKAVEFLVGVNFSQIFLMIIAAILGWGTPLLAEQLLIINVVSDGIPGFFLSQEPSEASTMEQPPISKKESIFSRGLGTRMFIRSLTFTILTLGVYALGRFTYSNNNPAVGMTMVFLVLSLGSMIDIYSIKDRKPISLNTFKSNPMLNIGLGLSMIAVLLLVSIPKLNTLFGFASLPPICWLIVIICAFIPVTVLEIYKHIKK